MNTSKLKRFATEARTKIRQGVILMMRQWGFDADGNVLEEPQLLQGGTLFRGKVIGSEAVDGTARQNRKKRSSASI